MKKVLVLVLVLAMASMASAALTLVSSAGDTLTPSDYTMIGVYNDTVAPNQGLMVYVVINEADISKGSWTGTSVQNVPPAPVAGTSAYYEIYEGYGDMWYWEPGVSVNNYGVGSIVDFEFHCEAVGDVTITLYAEDAVTVLDTLTIHQVVPEPMTVALLGLGGLLLRRRK